MRTKWICPICRQSSARHWNIKRHLDRKHSGITNPVNEQDLLPQRDASPPLCGSQTLPPYYEIYNYILTHGHKPRETSEYIEDILRPMRKMIEFKYLASELRPPYPSPLSMVSHTQQQRPNINFTHRQPVRIRNEDNDSSFSENHLK